MENNALTSPSFWNNMWSTQTLNLHSSLSVNTRNVRRVLRGEIRPGDKVLELGCAPGKYLAWVAKYLGAQVTGIDYSDVGINQADQIFRKLNLHGELIVGDFFHTTLRKR